MSTEQVLVCLSISFHGGKGKHIAVHSGRCSKQRSKGVGLANVFLFSFSLILTQYISKPCAIFPTTAVVAWVAWNADCGMLRNLDPPRAERALKRISCRSQPLWKICISANILFRSLSGSCDRRNTHHHVQVWRYSMRRVFFGVWTFRCESTDNIRQQTMRINTHSAGKSLPFIGSNVAALGLQCQFPFEVSFACGHSLGGAVVLFVVTWQDVVANVSN